VEKFVASLIAAEIPLAIAEIPTARSSMASQLLALDFVGHQRDAQQFERIARNEGTGLGRQYQQMAQNMAVLAAVIPIQRAALPIVGGNTAFALSMAMFSVFVERIVDDLGRFQEHRLEARDASGAASAKREVADRAGEALALEIEYTDSEHVNQSASAKWPFLRFYIKDFADDHAHQLPKDHAVISKLGERPRGSGARQDIWDEMFTSAVLGAFYGNIPDQIAEVSLDAASRQMAALEPGLDL
jgi:hypothetical protein